MHIKWKEKNPYVMFFKENIASFRETSISICIKKSMAIPARLHSQGKSTSQNKCFSKSVENGLTNWPKFFYSAA